MRHITSCELVVSAPSQEFWPDTELPEIVLAGRSNVGKSSFINAITNRKRLAYVGNTPGKTRLLNFFNLDDALMFVDVPGYGYANISKRQLALFGEMMEDYFAKRIQKKGLVLIVDARHKPTSDDVMMMDFARYHHMKILVIATKIDKLKRNEINKKIAIIKETLNVSDKMLIQFSSEKRIGISEAWIAIEKLAEI